MREWGRKWLFSPTQECASQWQSFSSQPDHGLRANLLLIGRPRRDVCLQVVTQGGRIEVTSLGSSRGCPLRGGQRSRYEWRVCVLLRSITTLRVSGEASPTGCNAPLRGTLVFSVADSSRRGLHRDPQGGPYRSQ
ncbi:hypothetical protein NDU88_008432 [Pleurodeles waltl]|uniref:Uncharacterized protein n=1 Tax=Pleurodeles waltl TaxID=8319 RepID=A0AAV7P0V9_PLEWA|nr:hypothetical protein NDU88_008432 [Pleurodeles waltl]